MGIAVLHQTQPAQLANLLRWRLDARVCLEHDEGPALLGPEQLERARLVSGSDDPVGHHTFQTLRRSLVDDIRERDEIPEGALRIRAAGAHVRESVGRELGRRVVY